MIGLQMVGLTDRGQVREQNEDSIATNPEIGLAVLADGMGGHQAGEVASRMAVDVVTRHVLEALARNPGADEGFAGNTAPEIRAVSDAIKIANTAIYEVARTRPECAGMGSTLVVVVFFGSRLCVGHVGDSRLYRLRQGKLEQLTQDHSVIQELVNRGLLTHEEARQTIGKNLVTRALGVDSNVVPDIGEQSLEDEDIYLLCSDGLNDMIPDEEIERMLAQGKDDLGATASRLVAVANERGGPDNISVILTRAGREFQRNADTARRLLNGIKGA